MNATQAITDSIADSIKNTLLDRLICPACSDSNADLIIDANEIYCSQCASSYPLFTCAGSTIPWLFEQAEIRHLEWRARLNGFLHINNVEQDRLKEGINDKRLSKVGQKRTRSLLEAKKQQREQVLSLLEPFDLYKADDSQNIIGNLQSKTPKTQGLDSYYNNIFRDWAWGNSENQQMLDAIKSVLDQEAKIGDVLTIGSGAGRLSYDLHREYSANYSLLLDINPLLMSAACRTVKGEAFELNEFPIAPINKKTFFATQNCSAPQVVNQNFDYLFADGMNPPVKPASFDTVLTPWLLDIIPQNVRDFIPRINQCLREGGIWLNTGSLAFFHKQAAWCYSEEEIIELIEKNGFELLSSSRKSIDYMCSPLSAHGRVENIFSFSARKIKNVHPPEKYEFLPAWIRNTSKSIPKSFDYEIESSKYLLQAQVLNAVDGKRSIEQIGRLIAQQYQLEITESIHAVKKIMIDSYEN